MDIEQVARVVKLIEGSQLHEVKIANGDQSIKVVNNINKQNVDSPVEHSPIAKPEDSSDKRLQVCSSYVGRVYLSQDDSTDNLVKVGDHIVKGQTICYIDELTRLLPVLSKKEGIVSSILVESGQNVEYGEPILELVMN